jgi:endonuclease-3
MNSKTAIAIKQLKAMKEKAKDIRLAAEWDDEFRILISTILSARNRDERTIPVAERLFERYPSAKELANAKLSEVEEIIRQINFHKNKSRNIVNTSKQIMEKYNGKIPHDIDKLLEFRGVGRKTANIFLSEMGEDAIGVDTHLGYISRKLGWSSNINPHKIEKDLQKLFPKRYWSKINSIAVRFGKSYGKKEKDKILDEIKRIK